MIAKKSGVNYVRCSYDELNLNASIYKLFGTSLKFKDTPSYNSIGFYMNSVIAKECLFRLGIDSKDIQLWSGFLGDRFLAGKWCGQKYKKQTLEQAAFSYASWYETSVRKELTFMFSYSPVENLLSSFDRREKRDDISWIEWIDFQQRQHYVKKSLELFSDAQYIYPLSNLALINVLVSADDRSREGRKLLNNYVIEKYSDLFSMPLSNYFGYSIRSNKLMFALDKHNRLVRKKIDKLLGTKCQRYNITPYSTETIGNVWHCYDELINEGLKYLAEYEVLRGLESLSPNTIKSERSTSQLWSSLGYMLKKVSSK